LLLLLRPLFVIPGGNLLLLSVLLLLLLVTFGLALAVVPGIPSPITFLTAAHFTGVVIGGDAVQTARAFHSRA
jgi:hypothetical protein